MSDSDEIKPLGAWAVVGLAAVKWLDKVGRLLIPLVVLVAASWATCRSETAKQTAEKAQDIAVVKSQEVKQKAESGYQVTRHEVEQLQERVMILERAAKAVQTEAARPVTARRRRPLPPVPVRVTEAKPLPTSLDKAKAVIEAKAPAAPAAPTPTPARKDASAE